MPLRRVGVLDGGRAFALADALRASQEIQGLVRHVLRVYPEFLQQFLARRGGPVAVDPDAPAEVNERIVRALHPHIGARLPLPDGSFLGVRRARVGEDGSLELLEVQPPGGRPMPYDAYLRGRS